MTVILPLPGVVVPSSLALPTVQVDEISRALGGVPGWKVLGDPAFSSGSQVRNRARRNQQMPSAQPLIAATINGQPAWDASANSGPRITPGVGMSPNEWSFFFAIRTPAAGASGGREILRSLATPSGAGIAPRVTIRTGGQIAMIAQDTSDLRVNGPTIPDNLPFVGMATFSVRDGCRMYINGVLAAANANDKRPLTSDFASGEYGVLRGSSAGLTMTCGIFGILDIDLGQPENAGHRRAINMFLMQKYQIA